MRETTEELVDSINSEATIEPDVTPVTKTRSLWNYEETRTDADIELHIGPYSDLRSLIEVVEDSSDWVIRHMDTGEGGYEYILVTLLHTNGLVNTDDATGMVWSEAY